MIKVLFICHGNICRSTMAQFVVNVLRDENGITTMSVYDFLLKDNSLEL